MKRIAMTLLLLLALAAGARSEGAPYEVTVYDETDGRIAAVGTVMSDADYTVLERMLPLPGTPWETVLATNGQIEWEKIAYRQDGEEKTGWIVGNPGVLADVQLTGSEADAVPGFVLCQSLTMRESASASAKAVYTLVYGDTVDILAQDGVWTQVSAQAGAQRVTGWVRGEYLLTDPAQYVSAGETAVYAYPGEGAPRVGLLADGETHPVIARLDGYIVISLRGASGFVRAFATICGGN